MEWKNKKEKRLRKDVCKQGERIEEGWYVNKKKKGLRKDGM